MDFKLGFQMLVKETGESVCFKPDGKRFGKPQTVKVNADTEYVLIFNFRPSKQLQNLLINNDIYKFEEKKGSIEDEDMSKTYKAKYTTVGENASEKGNRKDVRLALQFEDGERMMFSLQCKVYKVGETNHSQWGQKLSLIDMDCRLQKGQTYITVLKECYL